MQNRRIKAGVFVLAAAVILSLVWFGSCSSGQHWSQEQRKATQEMLRQWREITYLNDLTEEEFALFAGSVTDLLEQQYPSYVEFIEMPMVGDSVEMVVVAAIVTDIKASPDRLRHIFSYEELVDAKVLPSGMNRRQQADFYRCFAERVNMSYGSMQRFVWEALNSKLDDVAIAHMMRRCASPYWDVELDVVVVEE